MLKYIYIEDKQLMSSLLGPEYVRHMKRIRLGLIKLMLLLYYVLSVFFCGH